MKQVNLREIPKPTRTRWWVQFTYRAGLPAWPRQALDLISAADSTEDWNFEQNEGDLAMSIQQGVVRACDAAARGQQPPSIGVLGVGAPTFALTLGDLFATRVDHMPEVEVGSLSDHRVPALRGPPRRAQNGEDALPEDAPSHLDEAWALLSDTAEDLLCVSDAGGRAVPRSSEWRPAAKSMTVRLTDLSPGLRSTCV